MRFLLEPPTTGELADLRAAGEAAHEAGLDGVLIGIGGGSGAPLIAAAALAGAVPDVLIAVEVEVGQTHPLELAEEAAVVDAASGGRLILVVRPDEDEDRAGEFLDVLRTAFAARPFRHRGRHWQIPANRAQNVHAVERRFRLMPTPFQARLELWTSGSHLRPGLARGIGHLADGDHRLAALGAEWERCAATLGPAAIGAARARRHRSGDCDQLLAQLREGRSSFGQDWAVVAGAAGTARRLGHAVRPRVQLDSLPAGLEEHWQGSPDSRL